MFNDTYIKVRIDWQKTKFHRKIWVVKFCLQSTLKLVNRLVKTPALLQRGFKCVQVLLTGHAQLVREMLFNIENCNLFVDALETVQQTMIYAFESKLYKLGFGCSQLLTTMIGIPLRNHHSGMEIDNETLGRCLPNMVAIAVRAAQCLRDIDISAATFPHEQLVSLC